MSGRAPGGEAGDEVEVPLVLGAVVEVGLEVAGHAPERVVPRPLTENEERLGIVHEGRASRLPGGRPWADDEHGAHLAGEPERLGGHDDVVEDAETTATVGERVMRAAADVRRHAVRERKVRRNQRGTDGAARPLHELRRPGEPERDTSSASARRPRPGVGTRARGRARARRRLPPARWPRRSRAMPSAPSRTSLYFPSGNRCPSGSGYEDVVRERFHLGETRPPRRERLLAGKTGLSSELPIAARSRGRSPSASRRAGPASPSPIRASASRRTCASSPRASPRR